MRATASAKRSLSRRNVVRSVRGVMVGWAVGLAACGDEAVAQHLSPPAAEVEAIVWRVIDGDTIVVVAGAEVVGPDGAAVTGERVRLLGIDAPERHESCFGAEAQRFVHRAVAGRAVKLRFDPTRCRPPDTVGACRGDYGRLLAYVLYEAGGERRVLNEDLLRTGHARVLQGPVRFQHRDSRRYAQLERSAARAGLGLWRCR